MCYNYVNRKLFQFRRKFFYISQEENIMAKKIRLFATTLAITFAAVAFCAIITHMNNYNTANNALRLLSVEGGTQYMSLIESWDTTFETGVEHHELYQLYSRSQDPTDVVMVLTNNSKTGATRKAALVVKSDPDKLMDTGTGKRFNGLRGPVAFEDGTN